jgi:1,4-alpha-glucan branching enzyme
MKQDPVHRKYHHDTLTFSAVYAFNENFVLPLSHDEVVHGKGTVMTRMPGDEWQQAANMRAYYSYMFAHPGKKLNFMGNEFGQILEWNYRAQLDWGLLQQPRHRGIQALFRDLNKLYRNEASLHETDCEVDGFGWINSGDSQASVISLFRKSLDGKELILVVVNFTPMPREGYVLGAPVPGNYEILLNSDSEYYGGSNFPTASILTTHSGQADGQPQHLKVTLPPLSALFLKLSE